MEFADSGIITERSSNSAAILLELRSEERHLQEQIIILLTLHSLQK